MSTQTPEPPQAPPADPPKTKTDDHGPAPTMGDLRAMVTETVEGALKPFLDKLGAGGSSTPAPSTPAGPVDAGNPANLEGMVTAAIQKVLGDQKTQTAEEAHKKQHEQLAAMAERPPVERPRRSKWLGNIFD